MPAWTPKEKDWREWLTVKLRAAGQWEAFDQLRREFQRYDETTTGQCNKIASRKAWHRAAALFTEYFDQTEYEAKRSIKLKQDRITRKREGFKKAREAMAPKAKKAIGPLTERDLDRIVEPPDDEVVIIAECKEGDILRDTKWVYFNLARLIKIGRGGTKTLNKTVLREAPSNGAVGLAQYALEDQKAFMERFVVRILPKDEVPVVVPTESQLKAELDPGLDELQKYMKKNPQ